MTVAQQKYIFGLEGSAFAIFKIYPTEVSDGKLRDWIELSGGVCLEVGEDDPYAIPILDLAWCKRANLKVFRKRNSRDVFKSLFIYDCYTKDKLMDLNSYKIGDSILPEYNANLILQQKLSWNDVESGTSFQRPPRLTRKTRSTLASKRTQDDLQGGSCTSNQSNQLCSNTNEEFNNKSKKMLLTSSTAVTTSAGSSSVQIQKNVLSNGDSTTRGRTIPTPDDDNDVIVVTSQNRERSVESATSSSDDRSSRTSRRPSLSTNLPGISNETSWISVGRTKVNGPPKLPVTGTRRTSSPTSPTESVCSLHTDSDSESPKRGKRRPYQYRDGLKILEWICRHEKHFMTSGNQVWKEMQDAEVLSGRTWQSLKEHFRKKVLSNLDQYKCSKTDKKKFERANKVRRYGQKRPHDQAFYFKRPDDDEK